MLDKDSTRGLWTSKIGFIFAAAGSAIGLGNIWRFPYVTGENGGAAFVMIYIFFILVIGLPIMISELTIGRNTRKNPYGAFRKLKPGGYWKLAGGLGVMTGTLILSFYTVIAGFTIGYFFLILSGKFSGIHGVSQSGEIFARFSANPFNTIGLSVLFIVITSVIVINGVSKGIEKWSKIFMPVLVVLLILLVFRSVTLKGSLKGLEFYLKPNFDNLSVSTFIQALGQALFSLSLGGGGMMTYGSYLSRKEKLVSSAGYIAAFDTMIAILAGLIIFPALFAMGGDPEGGPGLIFVTLPSLIIKMPGGILFGASIFLLLTLAALTTTISLLEIPVAYFVDERGWSRKKATLLAASIILLLAIPSALSLGASGWLSKLPFFGIGFMDFIVIVFANYALVIGAFLIAVFVGYSWGIKPALHEIELYGNNFRLKRVWTLLVKYVCPVAILAILGYMLVTGNYF
ncbi:MAG: sodium-dependent transporter [Cyclobacteriaceae bacterium]|nr:sodium-dependent transporter [Cyclobacteriaceae bacterium]